jgi:hypothetical protein
MNTESRSSELSAGSLINVRMGCKRNLIGDRDCFS